MSQLSASRIAQSVLRLSDYFISNPQGETPWREPWAQEAYMNYYLPLNVARLKRIIQQGNELRFFDGLSCMIDFGAGPGSATLAFLDFFNDLQFYLIEKSSIAKKLAFQSSDFLKTCYWSTEFSNSLLTKPHQSLAVFSYSLTELHELPEWTNNVEALMIVEPSTRQDGRLLLKLRDKLMERGFYIWAPCTHQKKCPLLYQSKTDWCHDRIDFFPNESLKEIEKFLPMKNKTLTMCYLLARKLKPPLLKAARARIVGDLLEENGKNRQMVCRGEDREFLVWLHKNKIQHSLLRGDLLQIAQSAEKKSNEIRITHLEDVISPCVLGLSRP